MWAATIQVARDWWLRILLWGMFSLGVAVHLFAPHLAVMDHAFVIPPELVTEERVIVPTELIAKERRLRALAGLLTGGGALGLAFYYLRRPRAP